MTLTRPGASVMMRSLRNHWPWCHMADGRSLCAVPSGKTSVRARMPRHRLPSVGREPRHVLVADLLERRTGLELALTGHAIRGDTPGVEHDRSRDIDVGLLDQDLQVRRRRCERCECSRPLATHRLPKTGARRSASRATDGRSRDRWPCRATTCAPSVLASASSVVIAGARLAVVVREGALVGQRDLELAVRVLGQQREEVLERRLG